MIKTLSAQHRHKTLIAHYGRFHLFVCRLFLATHVLPPLKFGLCSNTGTKFMLLTHNSQ